MIKTWLTICRHSGQTHRCNMSSVHTTSMYCPKWEISLKHFDRKSTHFFEDGDSYTNFFSILNHYLGWEAISYKVIYYLSPCNFNPLIQVLELYKISLMKVGNFVIPKHIFSSFNGSSFETVFRHFFDLLLCISLLHGTLIELLDVLMFAFVKQFFWSSKNKCS